MPALGPWPGLLEQLTAREQEVLRWLAEGLSNRRIADAIAVSEDTVKFHLKNIYGKLHADSRLHAVRIALNAGLVA